MAEPKTRPTDASVDEFLANVADEARRADAQTVLELMQKVSKEKPTMWGTAIVGFGAKELVYPNGRTMDWPVIAFSPRKQNLVLYIMDGFATYDELLSKLGKHKTGKSCLYINKLTDVDLKVLKTLIQESIKHVKKG
ncbi:MAG: DUF1801 domain-containing protein [Betaproteobacteria bacterium]|nr:DUF1801 domain-containing protein [Betaproteobacteria bacterium]